jgi:hypothetical protein
MAKRSKSRKKREWKLPRIPLPNWENTRRGLIAAMFLLLVAAIVGAWITSVPRLQAHAARNNAPDAVVVSFQNSPAWVRGELEHSLMATVQAQLAADPFIGEGIIPGDPMDRDALVAVRNALIDTGWFEAVHQVRRVHAERIDIEATFADPYALIRWRERYYLIDSRGRLLPRPFDVDEASQLDHFISIVGTRYAPPGFAGFEWDGEDVIAALSIMQVIDQQPWRHQVRRVDVAGYVDRRHQPIRLITDRGSTIIWGRPPGEEGAYESLTDRKLAFLNLHFNNHRHIDGGHNGEIDITDHTRVFKR